MCNNPTLLYRPGRFSSLLQTPQVFSSGSVDCVFYKHVLTGVPAALGENDWRRILLSCHLLLPVMQSCFPLITLKGQGLQRHASFGSPSQKLPQRDYEIDGSCLICTANSRFFCQIFDQIQTHFHAHSHSSGLQKCN